MNEAEVERVLSNPDNLIMSEELSTILSGDESPTQSLVLDGDALACILVRGELLDYACRAWKFLLQVPMIEFDRLLDLPSIEFMHGDKKFSNADDITFFIEDGMSFLSLQLNQIIIDGGGSSDE